MCGLVGIALSSTATAFHGKDIRKAMSWLLKLDTYRGSHATGVAAMFPTKEEGWKAAVLKRPIPGEYFIDTAEYREFSKSFDDAALVIGHNRYATMGGMGSLSAHPHFTKDIVLAHNGTLRQFGQLAQTTDKDLTSLDSARIAAEFQATGSNKEAMENLIGDYALTWFDRRTDSLYLARNSARPLHYAVLERQMLVWASEPWLIQAVAATCKLTTSTVTKEVPTELLMQFNLCDFKVEYTTDKIKGAIFNFGGVTETEFDNNKGFTSYTNNAYDSYHNHYHGGPDYATGRSKTAPNNVVPLGNDMTQQHIQAHNKILDGTGLTVGSRIDVTINHVEYSNKKKKRNGWASGVSVGKPAYQVVAVSVNEDDFEDDAFSYQCEITGAACFNGEELVLYCRLGSVRQRLMSSSDYAKIVQGDEKMEDKVKSVLGTEMVVSYNEDDEDTVDVSSFVKGPKGVFMSVRDFDHLVACGCVSCGAHISSEESEHVQWVGDCTSLPMCPACVDEDGGESFVLPYNGFQSVVN